MSQSARFRLSAAPVGVVLFLLVSIFAAEFGIMAVIVYAPPFPLTGWMAAAADAFILSALLIPVLYVVVFRPQLRNLGELTKAESDLRAMHEDLESRVRERTLELEQRNRESTLLVEMGDFLHACGTQDEAYAVITRTAEQLFPDAMGALFISTASPDEIESKGSWGGLALTAEERVFAPDECWALRLGRMYRIEDSRTGQCCRHVPPTLLGKYLCVPMIAQGELLGVFHLRQKAQESGAAGDTMPLNERLALILAEQLALAVVNLKLRERLRDEAIHDPLTGLFNRRYMEETLTRELGRAERRHGPLGVVMLDIDHFKNFNDTHGHEAGDLLLREMGKLLNAQIRGGDVACRYGGEEFALILSEMPREVVRQRVEALRRALKRLDLWGHGEALGSVTVSAGIAMYPDHGETGESLLRSADRALYRAKAEGRDRVVCADNDAPALKVS